MSAELANWVPAPLLAVMVLGFGAWFARLFFARLDLIEETQKKMAETVIGIKEQMQGFATREQIGSMGNRFDERVGNIRERLAVLESQRERG